MLTSDGICDQPDDPPANALVALDAGPESVSATAFLIGERPGGRATVVDGRTAGRADPPSDRRRRLLPVRETELVGAVVSILTSWICTEAALPATSVAKNFTVVVPSAAIENGEPE